MTSAMGPEAPSAPLISRSWRIATIGVLTERAYRARLLITPVTLAVQLFLYDRLWTAVFTRTTANVGLGARQTISYALLALLISRVRWSARSYFKDTISVVIREGTIGYWYLRPISAARYYMWRQAGDMCYGAGWAVAGCIVGIVAGAILPVRGSERDLWALVSLVLGQVVLYYIGLVLDLSTFWLIDNGALKFIFFFIQDLLTGVFVPLWFLPGSGLLASAWSPFSSGVNVPVSIYIGKIPLPEISTDVAIQVLWIVALAVLTRWLWSRAARRVVIQGG